MKIGQLKPPFSVGKALDPQQRHETPLLDRKSNHQKAT